MSISKRDRAAAAAGAELGKVASSAPNSSASGTHCGKAGGVTWMVSVHAGAYTINDLAQT
jgi:hypothetical protein